MALQAFPLYPADEELAAKVAPSGRAEVKDYRAGEECIRAIRLSARMMRRGKEE